MANIITVLPSQVGNIYTTIATAFVAASNNDTITIVEGVAYSGEDLSSYAALSGITLRNATGADITITLTSSTNLDFGDDWTFASLAGTMVFVVDGGGSLAYRVVDKTGIDISDCSFNNTNGTSFYILAGSTTCGVNLSNATIMSSGTSYCMNIQGSSNNLLDVNVDNCLLHSGGHGLRIFSTTGVAGSVSIKRTVIRDVTNEGIYVAGKINTSLDARFNLIYNTNVGIRFDPDSGYTPTTTIYRNTFNTTNRGIEDESTHSNPNVITKGNWGRSLEVILDSNWDYNGYVTISGIAGAHDVVTQADPGFIDMTNNDYRLLRSSELINVGFDTGDATDIAGNLTPYNEYADIGAYEYAVCILNNSSIGRLLLDWDFEAVTNSDTDGEFLVDDFSSGSVSAALVEDVTGQQYPGKGSFFAENSTNVITREYLNSQKQELPENLHTSDAIQILQQDDVVFTKDTRPVSYFYAFEKSMNQIISEEMVNWFSTIEAFNNLIGEPVNKYRDDYKSLGNLREKFFARVENEPDFDKFVEFYKWFDESLSIFLQQLVPASADFSNEIQTVIESHILERSKYRTKFPTLELRLDDPEDAVSGSGVFTSDLVNRPSGTLGYFEERIPDYNQDEPGDMYDHISKTDSALTVENKRFTTSSQGIGNFQHNYEVVQTSGRKDNNRYLTKENGIDLTQTASIWVSGTYDRILPELTGSNNRSIFVERFSAPGGVEVMSRGFLDAEAEEYSAYNAMPWRNTTVREALDTLQEHHMDNDGYDATFGNPTASYHKTNKNAAYYLKREDGVVALSSVYDNAFVQHAIPQSDKQYTWITASVDVYNVFGYLPSDGWTSSSDGWSTAPLFLTGADGVDIPFSDYLWITSPDFQYELTSSKNTLSYPAGIDVGMFLVNLRLNGPYQYPSWKQTRTGEHKIARYNRENNILSTMAGDKRNPYVYRNVTETPVSSKYFPLKHKFLLKTGQRVEVESAYGNNLVSFASMDNNYNRTDKALGYVFTSKDFPQMYDDLKSLYLDTDIPLEYNPIEKFESLTYKEVIYPREENTYLSRTNTRENYEETAEKIDERDHRTFWRDSAEDRQRTTGVARNSQNELIFSQSYNLGGLSIWPMANASGSAVSNPDDVGELMCRNDMQYGEGYKPVSASLVYSRPGLYRAFGSLAIGDYTYDIPEQSGRTPFFDSYEEYAKDIKKIATKYTTLPEYRVSDHMDYYLDNDFFSRKKNDFLRLDGADVTSSAISATADFDDNFFREYSHTDMMKHFAMINDDHDKNGIREQKLSLTCNTVKKLLPYDGFYPQTRVIQLGTMFSQSYSDHVELKGTTSDDETFMGFLRPFMSPGVLFNSIKSGIAVDFPIYTGSVGSAVEPVVGFEWLTGAPNYRVSFEELFNPKIGSLPNTEIQYAEPLGSANSSVVWDGFSAEKYELGMHNFLAESVKFFLENETLTTYVSEPENKFKTVVAGNKYYMDVELYRTDDMKMYGHNIIGGETLVGIGYGPETIASHISDMYIPYTPPYYHGRSAARLIFEPTETGQYSLIDIFANLEVESSHSYSNSDGTVAGDNFMPISASINLFGKAIDKKFDFNIVGNSVTVDSADTSLDIDKWVISSMFESPVLNYRHLTGSKAGSYGTGMWHQYGEELTGSTGIWFSVEESFKVEDIDDPLLTGSLMDVCGFKKVRPSRIGKIADKKEIAEAVVAIPFVTRRARKEFINIEQVKIDQSLRDLAEGKEIKTSITDMVDKMQRFLLPPQFDFLKDTTLNPLVMYIFEFKHTLSKQDLANIWQGVMPDISYTAEKDSKTISHTLEGGEFFSNGKLPTDLKWMVFKIKKKAEWNYYNVTADSTDDARFAEQFNIGGEGGIDKLPYSYNWPMDFCSLIELAQIDTEVEFAPDNDEGIEPITDIPPIVELPIATEALVETPPIVNNPVVDIPIATEALVEVPPIVNNPVVDIPIATEALVEVPPIVNNPIVSIPIAPTALAPISVPRIDIQGQTR